MATLAMRLGCVRELLTPLLPFERKYFYFKSTDNMEVFRVKLEKSQRRTALMG